RKQSFSRTTPLTGGSGRFSSDLGSASYHAVGNHAPRAIHASAKSSSDRRLASLGPALESPRRSPVTLIRKLPHRQEANLARLRKTFPVQRWTAAPRWRRISAEA